MINFKQFCYLINEVKDTRRNRVEVIQAYGLRDHAPEHVAQERAKELIDKFTKLEPLIDPNHDYFGAPGKKYNPKDILEDYLIEDILQRAFSEKYLVEQKAKIDYNLDSLYSIWKTKR